MVPLKPQSSLILIVLLLAFVLTACSQPPAAAQLTLDPQLVKSLEVEIGIQMTLQAATSTPTFKPLPATATAALSTLAPSSTPLPNLHAARPYPHHHARPGPGRL